jgi:H+-translocating NAD(P) transhydrogenase subunit alpha
MTTVGVVREQAPGERRVSLVPDVIDRLTSAGLDVLVEAGAGAAASFSDDAYEKAGARTVSPADLYEHADVITCVNPPGIPTRAGQVLVGMLEPLRRPERVSEWAGQGVTAVSLDTLPRTLSRAQSMDALSSQANIAGYKAVLLAANAYGRFFPMLTTAAGTVTPATVLVLGAGVAGLAAIGTARRLGAVVTAYDIRPQARGEAESVGARFLDLNAVGSGSGTGGYARALDDDEQQALQEALARHIPRFDVVITTAQVPGRRPPVVVTQGAVRELAAGSVVVDMAASELGGNVEGSVPGQTIVTANGVTVIGAVNLPAMMASAASTAYARNLTALLTHMVRDGAVHIDPTDEIQAGVLITHQGTVVHPDVATLVNPSETGGGGS